jgi:hypothetical protein
VVTSDTRAVIERLRATLAHKHTDGCYKPGPIEDCGEHHAHGDGCRGRIKTCRINLDDVTRDVWRTVPALLAIAEAAGHVVGEHTESCRLRTARIDEDMTCNCGLPELCAALDALGGGVIPG